ncbi:MAG: LarC family nickel insertion protein [Nitrospinota bacterium]|nr:LarC family nickel insertion protein [Nitrospinota bacterium]
MQKKSSVIIAMADHAPGEALGAAMEDILKLGAHGVQAIASITKKNRPGAILVIEPGEAEAKIAEYLARELKIGGYQRFATEHVFHQARFIEKKVTVRVEGAQETFELRVKVVGPEEAPLYVSVEADDAIRISRSFEEGYGIIRPLHMVKGALESAAAGPGNHLTIDL